MLFAPVEVSATNPSLSRLLHYVQFYSFTTYGSDKIESASATIQAFPIPTYLSLLLHLIQTQIIIKLAHL